MIKWDNDTFSVGHKEIDEQHKFLINIINELTENIDQNNINNKIIDKLFEYMKFHFLTEEKYFLKYNYVDTNKHIKEHNTFVNYIIKIYNEKNVDYLELLSFLQGWLITHIKNSDMKYKYLFIQNKKNT